MPTLFLSPTVLSWQWRSESSTVYSEDAWRRPYEHWRHADEIDPSISEFKRIDIITTLKRAVDHRVRALMGLYDLRGLPLSDAPKEHLELLEYVGLVRPLMVSRLITIRNAVDHEDAAPPSPDECRTLTEFVWYFLRSTDRVVRFVVDSMDVAPPDQNTDQLRPYGMRVAFSDENDWIPRISGRFRKETVSSVAIDSWINVQVKKIESGADMISRWQDSPEGTDRQSAAETDPEDFFLRGEIRGPGNAIREIVRTYFEIG
jgi:hypothetical protein